MHSLPPDQAEPDPAYRAVLDWVWSFSARVRTQDEIVGQRAVKLDRMRALMRLLDDPHAAFPSLLIAGTKGKGSTVAMLAACLHAAGLRTGRYTSPHLVNWRERTWIDGHAISTDAVVALAEPMRRAVAALPLEVGQPTTFEVGTAFAFLHFARQHVDVAVLEVGVGGRHDATNVVEPLVSAITPISYDHTPTLGSTLADIASHKAGILRPGKPGILGCQPDEARAAVERHAHEIGTPLEEVGREWRWAARPEGNRARAPIVIESTHPDAPPLQVQVGLLGDHQRDNATTAVAALHSLAHVRPDLAASPAAIATGLADVDWPGRLQVLRREPLLVLDGAHNAFSAEVVGLALEQNFTFKRLLLVLGLSQGKDAQGVLDGLGRRADHIFVTRSHHERSTEPGALADLARARFPGVIVEVSGDVASAVEAAMLAARLDDLVLITGSLFVVGEAMVWWGRSPR
jgi:dihydrofolate synthase/folylpolyglutamate synthase